MSVSAIVLDVLWMTAATIVTVILIGTFARRVLGVRVGVVRIVVAGAVGLGAEIGFESQVVWRSEQPYTPALIPIQLGIILLVAIAFLVVLDIVAPQGSIPRPNQWIPGVRKIAGRARRYSQLVRLAVQHKLIPFTLDLAPTTTASQERHREAIALKAAMEEAGGAFVKVGQILSTRADILPPEFAAELGTLQQRVPPAPWNEIQSVLLEELGRPVDEAFTEIGEKPVAAASIGQVHLARLITGERVAVKIQRPGIIPLVEQDVEITRRLAARLTESTTWARQFGITDVAESVASSLLDELDYRVEASNLAALHAGQQRRRPDERVRTPRLFPGQSSRRLLVMEFVDGRTLSDESAVDGISDDRRSELATLLLSNMLSQIMDDGVFHADLHPGNVMITPDGGLALLDFGSVGRLDSQVRRQITNLLLSVAQDDASLFADALLAFVEIPDDLDEATLRRQIGQFMARHLGPGVSLDSAAFSQVIMILATHHLAIPPQLTVAVRAIGTLEGTLQILDPAFDFVAQSSAYARRRMREDRRPAAVARATREELSRLLPVLQELPYQAGHIARSLAEGRLNLNIRLLADRRDREVLRTFVNLASVTFLAGVFGIMAAMFLTSSGGVRITATLTLHDVFGYLLVFASGVLTLRALFDVFGRSRL